MARRAGAYVDEPTLSTARGGARKGRELEPDWAKGLSLDEIHDESAARRLPLDTNPDDIDDPDVRGRFVKRLQNIDDGTPYDEDREGEPGSSPTKTPKAPRGGGKGGPARDRAAAQWFGRPTLTPPRRLSARDGTGFAFGLLLYALGVNFLQNGPDGVRAWVRAKLFNQTSPDFRGIGGSIGKGATDPAVIGALGHNQHDPTGKTHGRVGQPTSPDIGPKTVPHAPRGAA